MWQVINSPFAGYNAVARAVKGQWVFHAVRFRSIGTAQKCADRLNAKAK